MERIVLVGTGGFGRCWRSTLAARGQSVEVVGVIEPDPSERARAIRDFQLSSDRALAHIDGLSHRLGADAAIDSSPFKYRRYNATMLFAAGIDLLAAKPLSGSLADAQAIVQMAREGSRSVAVAQQMRYFPCFLALQRLLTLQAFGAVRAVDVQMALDGREWTPGRSWRLKMQHPLLLEAGIHHFDLLRWCLSTEIAEVSAVESNPPWSSFKNGATVVAVLRSVNAVPITYEATFAPAIDQVPIRFDSGWRVVCDDATITVVDGGIFVDGKPTEIKSSSQPVSLEVLNDALFDAWLTARSSGAHAPFHGEDNLHSMAVVDKAIRSAKSRRLEGV